MVACTCHDGLTCIPCYHALLTAFHRPTSALAPLTLPPVLPPAETSTQLQARIQAVARRLGGWQRFSVRRSDKAMVAAGFPDDLLAGHGRLVLVEYKMERQNVSIPQQGWLEVFWRNDPHAECYVGWPSDEERLVTLLQGQAPHPRDRHWMTRLPLPCTCEDVS